MLNYTEKNPKHLYPKLNGLGDNGNCRLPSGPRTIAVSWRRYLLVRLPAELRAREHSCEV
jgi:hypothetical protein